MPTGSSGPAATSAHVRVTSSEICFMGSAVASAASPSATGSAASPSGSITATGSSSFGSGAATPAGTATCIGAHETGL